ncbi:FtsQ-type POTRA domain-containing protein [Arthrobacter sp. zg-ZUI100]|uniref:cell division protein FtsQ/DivIB n=1 Tax=Arthrobacter jiangjiafuii TaxID=2817475 RepID=UPI001AEDB566|nr:FtsQ-type POTRA domain-containing protein [Arthrobacter jiangjiafuii]MBP3036847.1 FtsQ-type POTRA domain-containing protein [Arthrobacter jiangjiafuii]
MPTTPAGRLRGTGTVGSRKPRRPPVDAVPGSGSWRRTPSAPSTHSAPSGSTVHGSAGTGAGTKTGTRTGVKTGANADAAVDTQSGGDVVSATVLAFPEPPARRRKRRLIGWGLTAVVVLGAFFALLFFSPALALKTVTVQGNSLLPTEEAQRALQPLMGEPLTTISDADVAALLADRPEVAGVEVIAQPPSEIVVSITERVPVAVLQSGESFLLIDAEGRTIGTAVNRAQARLPLIDGGTEAVNSRVFSTVTSVLSVLPPKVLEQLDHASAGSVDSVELKLVNGQSVFWGSAESNVAKARVLEAMLGMPAKEPAVKVFDVSTPNAPVTR